MGRLIQVDDPQQCQSPLEVLVGDLLFFRASGGRVSSGGSMVELIGPLMEAVVGTNGMVVAPMGSPNVVLFRVLRPGKAGVEVVTGDPWTSSATTQLELTVRS